MRCPKCGTGLPEQAVYCYNCGFKQTPSFCPNCGGPVLSDDKFCMTCGTALTQDGKPMAKNSPKKNKKNRTWIFILLAVLCVVLAAAGIIGVFLWKSRQAGTETKSGQEELTENMTEALSGSIAGTVISSSDGSTAISGASVTILDEDGTVIAQLTTDADGIFDESLPSGTYSLLVERDGYESTSNEITVNADEEVSISISLTKRVTNDDAMASYAEFLNNEEYLDETDGTGTIQYAACDLNDDGINELLLHYAAASGVSGTYDIYSYDGKVAFIGSCDYFNHEGIYYSATENALVIVASGGADWITYEFYDVSDQLALSFTLDHNFFGPGLGTVTDENPDGYEIWSFSIQKPGSEETDITEDEWNSYIDGLTEISLTELSYTVASGTCGDSLTWELTSDGTLTISGSGDMSGWNPSSSSDSGYATTTIIYEEIPWVDYKNTITSVVIENGVTSIGIAAFYECISLTSITIPESVTVIHSHAFFGCISLTEIVIPDSVTAVDDHAFYHCTNLASAQIGNNVTTIGLNAFNGCVSLSSVRIPGNMASISSSAFYQCTSLTDVYYAGTESEWSSISIGKNNEYLTSAAIHYES